MTSDLGSIATLLKAVLIVVGIIAAMVMAASTIGAEIYVDDLYIVPRPRTLAHTTMLVLIVALAYVTGGEASAVAFTGNGLSYQTEYNKAVWIDTGCTKSVFNNEKKLIHVRPTPIPYIQRQRRRRNHP